MRSLPDLRIEGGQVAFAALVFWRGRIGHFFVFRIARRAIHGLSHILGARTADFLAYR